MHFPTINASEIQRQLSQETRLPCFFSSPILLETSALSNPPCHLVRAPSSCRGIAVESNIRMIIVICKLKERVKGDCQYRQGLVPFKLCRAATRRWPRRHISPAEN